MIKKIIKNILKALHLFLSEHEMMGRIRYYRNAIKTYFKENPQNELTKIEKREIQNYWNSYGIKIRDFSWFKWYYGVTGIKNPRFIPWDILDEVIVPYLNDQNKKYAWRDKCYFYQFIPSVTFPKIIFKRINDRYYDENGNLINDIYNSNIKELLIKQENIIFKPGFGAFGRAVEKHHITSNSDAEKLITDHEYLQHYLVQEVVKQHKFFDQFNSSSVNIMRINTLFHNGKVEILDNAMVRFGLPGYHTDVAFVNGKEIVRAVGITKEGHLKSHFWDLYGHKSKLEEYEYTEVPMWDEVRKTVIDGASKMPYFSFIAWDVTVNDQNEVVVIEYNIDFPGSVIYQYDQPFFGNVTDSLLNEIKLHHEIPRFYRN